MPVKVTRDPELPLLMATLTGEVVVEDIVEIFRRSEELMTPEDDELFRITYVGDAHTTFPEMFKAIQNATLKSGASILDQRIHTIFVGSSTWITFARNAMLQRGLEIPAFENMAMAMEYIHWRLDEATMRKQASKAQ
ncbi:hypothetical protein G4Y79_24290 [Phototrophicus methaneseepsis]|uniref:STAS/SEC14 domain-containing protein n=1 Tax=Phototrophicus methaneseepsis TaxID=2710758 RepID=A0A7S8E9B3_9CHLR|nr:hypothetical protein [Phototrophicus methaneseepsis]QPC82766.1 hypothetical protein G4Y79_24290 [Phototrophicus methaneseepsis]